MDGFYRDYIENGYVVQVLVIFNLIMIVNQVMEHLQGAPENRDPPRPPGPPLPAPPPPPPEPKPKNGQWWKTDPRFRR